MATAATAADSGKTESKMRKVAATYAACVVRRHHDKASEAILATANNHTIIHDMAQIIDADCLGVAAGHGVNMRFPNDTYRYALSDALVNADFADHGYTSFDDRLPLAQPEMMSSDQRAERLQKAPKGRRRKEAERDIAKQNALAWVGRYGECIVRNDPVNARYWLLTPAETPEEVSRIKAMQPAFASCLDGGMVHFTRTLIRGTVAVNYYRLAKATTVSNAGSAH